MTTDQASTRPLNAPPGHYRFLAVLASEWTKLRSVRSTVWTLLVTVFVGVGIGALVTSARASRFAARTFTARLAFDPTRSSLAGILIAQLAIGVLGVLVMSAEYSSGTIRDTFSAVPRRPLVLAAKVLVFSVVTLVVGEVVCFVSFLIGQRILSGRTPTASLSNAAVLRAVVSGGLYLVVLGLLALGLATILRHTAAAISTFVGVLLILPILADVLPTSYSDDIARFLPAEIGNVMISARPRVAWEFNPWVGFALLVGYALALLGVGAVLLVRRDA